MSGIETATPTSPCGRYHAYNLADCIAAGAEDTARIRLDKARIRLDKAFNSGDGSCGYHSLATWFQEFAEAYAKDDTDDDLPDLMTASDTDDDLPDQIADSAS